VTSLAQMSSTPNSATVQLEMVWDTNKNGKRDAPVYDKSGKQIGGDLWEVGSGALIAPNYVLTAGHCIFNNNKADVGTPSYGYAKWVLVHAGQTGKLGPDKTERDYRPFGEALGVAFSTPSGWRVPSEPAKNINDIGLIKLDRNLGSYAGRFDYGWLGEQYFQQKGEIHSLGYPAADNKFIGLTVDEFKGHYQYSGSGPVKDLIDNNRVFTFSNNDLKGEGGSSGSPIYVTGVDLHSPYWGNVPTIIGVWVRGDKNGFGWRTDNEATRITPELFDWINSIVHPQITPDNRYAFPPAAGIDKSDLMGYDNWFGTSYTQYSRGAHNTLHVTLPIWNGGTQTAKNLKVTFYATTALLQLYKDPATASPKPTALGTATLGSVLPFTKGQPVKVNVDLTLPASLKRGHYFIGWYIDSGRTSKEFKEDNNYPQTFKELGEIVYNGPGSWEVVPTTK
jgi:hypothetical protein